MWGREWRQRKKGDRKREEREGREETIWEHVKRERDEEMERERERERPIFL